MSIPELIEGQKVRPSKPLAINLGGQFAGNRNDIIGGQLIPTDIPWTACTLTKGSGDLEARMVMGVVSIRGTVKITGTSGGTFTQISSLPEGFIGPSTSMVIPVHAIDTGNTYRIGEVRLDMSGAIGVAATSGKMDTIYFDGVRFEVY